VRHGRSSLIADADDQQTIMQKNRDMADIIKRVTFTIVIIRETPSKMKSGLIMRFAK